MSSTDVKECRICFLNDGQLLSPCLCSGTMAHIHHNCQKKWVEISGQTYCRICGHKWIGFEVIATEMNFYDYLKSNANQREDIKGIIFAIILHFFGFVLYLYCGRNVMTTLVSHPRYNQILVIFHLFSVLCLSIAYQSIKIILIIISDIYSDFQIWKQYNYKFKILP